MVATDKADNKPVSDKKDDKKEGSASKDGKKKDKKEELSEEDKELIAELQLLIDRLQDVDTSLHMPALETIRSLIRTSTSSMTSVPKPLKFLRKHFDNLLKIHETMVDGTAKRFLSDIISVLSMTMPKVIKRPTLKYRLTGSEEPVGSWGHEYVRYLSAEIGQEFTERSEAGVQSNDDLVTLAKQIVPFFMTHNAEADACDLLMELDLIQDVVAFVDSGNYHRVSLYLLSCVSYVPEPEDQQILEAILNIYTKLELRPEALIIALRMNNIEIMRRIFDETPAGPEKKQLAYILARQQVRFETNDPELDDIINNTRLSERFIALGRELEVLEPKVPEDVYKSHLEPTRPGMTTTQADSAKQNLSSTFVNAFLNAGFGRDKLMTEDGNAWIFKHKDHGKMSAAASLGMILLWDVEVGLTQIDKYLYLDDDHVKAGALLAVGIVNSTVRNDCDPAQALLSEFVENKSSVVRLGAIAGLAMAYAGSNRSDIIDLLLPLVGDTTQSVEISGLATLAVGIIGVAGCSEDASSTILQMLLERDAKQLQKETFSRFIALGLGLLYLGRQQAADAILEALKAVPDPVGKQASVLLDVCAYAGTGNVLKIQKMLHHCTDHIDSEKEDDGHQAFAALGIAIIAMGEEIGTEMSFRSFNHLMHYGEPVIRRVVPLALGLLCASNPQEVQVIDTLSKYSHDNDIEVAQSAIFAMGLVGAGTNNARLAQMLRQLASYYQKDANNLFVVRIAQGLLHMSKGTVTVNPYHSNRQLVSPVAVAGLLTILIAMTDAKNTILSQHHYLLYFLSTSMYPRMFVTLDEAGHALPVSVRVGQAVDVVGQAGRPKTITGFQTHTTPVLLGHGERAELATEEYLPLTKVLEGFVILKKNPEYVQPEDEKPVKK